MRWGAMRSNASSTVGWHPERDGSSTTASGVSSRLGSTSSTLPVRNCTLAMPAAFSRASAMAAVDSSTAITRLASGASNTAKAPTPA